MNDSLSFDRAVNFYDQTRPLPEPVAQKGVQAILDIAGRAARILEVGAGTGRISVPLLEHGADLVGCDLSAGMLKRLQEKSPSARVTQADAASLPFASAHFDALLTVHVIHLIAPWREALREFKRILVPGGKYLNVSTYAAVGTSVREQVRSHWRTWIEEHEVKIHQPGVRDFDVFLQELRSLGAELSEVDVAHFAHRFTLRDELERFANRIYSDAWDVPEEVHAASVEELRTWVLQEYKDLDEPREDEVRFVINVAAFKK